MDLFLYKTILSLFTYSVCDEKVKKSITLKNQDFINYLEKIVELLITIDPILTGKSCWKWGCGCTITFFSSLHNATWLISVIKSLNSDPTQSILEKQINCKGGHFAPDNFFYSTSYKTGKILIFWWHFITIRM